MQISSLAQGYEALCFSSVTNTPFSQHYSLVSVRASQGELRAPGASQEHGSLSVASGPGPGLPGNPVLQEVFSQGYSEGWS